eukprot:TRINITY_DN35326_c0_g1_i1.p1 TRINITY_DN35326_c0_g1~~TRINITY_DN35326_c0_g1_i1.p1  ORF type:complete len:440 (+),score=81.55 TRINITY_DN35326_c0_g1_i1:133-1320(+)
MASETSDTSESKASPVVLHCFRARNSRDQEVPVSAELVFAEACLGLYAACGGTEPIVVESPLPYVTMFGELPGAFIDCRPVPARLLVHLLRAQRLAAATAAAVDGPEGATREIASEEAWAARVEACLAPALELTLWAYGPCYRRHTRSAVLQGACLAGWPWALASCWQRRRRARSSCGNKGTKACLEEQGQELEKLLDALEERSACLCGASTSSLRLDELILLAYGKPLMAVPEDLLPFSPALLARFKPLVQAAAGRLDESTAPRTPRLGRQPVRPRWDGWECERADGPDAKRPWKNLLTHGAALGVSRSFDPAEHVVGTPQVAKNILRVLRWPWLSGGGTPAEDDADPILESPLTARRQRRDNAIFAVWMICSTTALFAYSLHSHRRQKVVAAS